MTPATDSHDDSSAPAALMGGAARLWALLSVGAVPKDGWVLVSDLMSACRLSQQDIMASLKQLNSEHKLDFIAGRGFINNRYRLSRDEVTVSVGAGSVGLSKPPLRSNAPVELAPALIAPAVHAGKTQMTQAGQTSQGPNDTQVRQVARVTEVTQGITRTVERFAVAKPSGLIEGPSANEIEPAPGHSIKNAQPIFHEVKKIEFQRDPISLDDALLIGRRAMLISLRKSLPYFLVR